MARSDLRRFVHPDTLSAIAPDLLRELLARWPQFAERHELELTEEPAYSGTPEVPEALEHPDAPDAPDAARTLGEALGDAIQVAGVSAPADLLDALYLIDEMRGDRESEALREAAWAVPVLASELASRELTNADVATLVYLRARPVLDQLHAKRHVRARRSFDVYASVDAPQVVLPLLEGPELHSLTEDLDSGLARPGQLRQVLGIVSFRQDGEHHYLVRRRGPPKRVAVVEGSDASSLFYHPEIWDVLVVDPVLGTLRINAHGAKVVDLYRRKMGLHLLGHEEQFPRSDSVYTLAPLLEGPHALSCADIDGMEAVSLVGVSWRSATRPGAGMHVKDSVDVLAFMRAEELRLPPAHLLLEARMRVLFSDSETPRPAVVRVPNVASITRGPDARIFDEFLRARGFAISREGRSGRAPLQPTLAWA